MHLFASMVHRLRDVAQLTQLKMIYGLRDESDLSDSRDEERTGLKLPNCAFYLVTTDFHLLIRLVDPDFVFVYPQDHAYVVNQSLKTRIAAYLSTNYADRRSRSLCPRAYPHIWQSQIHSHSVGRIGTTIGRGTLRWRCRSSSERPHRRQMRMCVRRARVFWTLASFAEMATLGARASGGTSRSCRSKCTN